MNDNDRYRLPLVVTSDVDLSAATVELAVDATSYACTWTETPTLTAGKWTGKAQTTTYFAGMAHPSPAGATVLARGSHTVEIRVTSGGTTVATELPSIWVR